MPSTAPVCLRILSTITALRTASTILNGCMRSGLIGPRELRLMKPTAFLINAARAALVDQEGLRNALRNRTIAGAAIDVYLVEPALEDGLIGENFENLVATPLVGSYTAETLHQMDLLAVRNVLEVLKESEREEEEEEEE